MTPDFTHDHYRRILASALEAGYDFRPFGDIEAARAGAGQSCFLRHDCDNDLVAAVAMASIEADTGIRSTWFVMLRSAMYNLLTPANRDLVQTILGQGHWLGLHFDAAAYRDAEGATLRDQVQREREIIEAEFGTAVSVMSFHQPGDAVLACPVDAGMLNTYDRSAFEGVFYTSDSNMTFREGCPSELFRAGLHRSIQLLIHPEWWTAEPMAIEDKWARMLANNFELTVTSLETREKAYRRRHRMRLDRE